MWILLPVDKILAKLSSEGFLKGYQLGSTIVPNAKTSWIFLNHHSILFRYNMLIKRLLDYYSIVTNRYIFHLIVNFILKHSCAKTLARKYRLNSRSKVFATFGKKLTTKEKPYTSFYTEPHY